MFYAITTESGIPLCAKPANFALQVKQCKQQMQARIADQRADCEMV